MEIRRTFVHAHECLVVHTHTYIHEYMWYMYVQKGAYKHGIYCACITIGDALAML